MADSTSVYFSKNAMLPKKATAKLYKAMLNFIFFVIESLGLYTITVGSIIVSSKMTGINSGILFAINHAMKTKKTKPINSSITVRVSLMVIFKLKKLFMQQ